jgi:hypothetical protein
MSHCNVTMHAWHRRVGFPSLGQSVESRQGHDGNMENRKRKAAGRPELPRYTTRIIKAGALLNDTKTLLSHWDSGQSVKDNLRRFQKDNLFGKASRSRVEDILRIFRQRYLKEEEVTRALVVLVQRRFPAAGLDRILYYHAAKADCLLHDVVTEILPTRTAQGISDIDVIDLQHELAKWVAQRRTTTQWSEPTTRRVAQGLLSTLRDFGVLAGAVNKQIAPAYLPTEAFAYVMFHLFVTTFASRAKVDSGRTIWPDTRSNAVVKRRSTGCFNRRRRTTASGFITTGLTRTCCSRPF